MGSISKPWVEFSTEGFFGYGEKGNFQYWGLAHFLPILLLIAVIFLIFKFRNKLRTSRFEENIRFTLAFAIILVEMSYFWRLLYCGPSSEDAHSFAEHLPLQVCEWSAIATAFALMKKSKLLYGICFFVTLSCGVVPLFTPAVISTTGGTYYRYYQFWLEHCLPIIGVFYMSFVLKFKIRKRDILNAVIALLCLAVVCVIANLNIPNANYMYLQSDTAGNSIANILPNNMFIRLPLYAGIIIVLFIIIYAITQVIYKHQRKAT